MASPAGLTGLGRRPRALLHLGYWTFFAVLMLLVWALSLGPLGAPDHPARGQGWLAALAQLPADPRALALLAAPLLSYAGAARWLAPHLGRPGGLALALLLASAPAGALLGVLALWPSAPWPALVQPSVWLLVFALLSAWGLVQVGGALLVQGFAGWWRERALRSDAQQALLRARLDPHFLFNALNNLDQLIATDARAAAAYVQGLSELLRYVLYESQAPWVPLASELSAVEHFLALERWRSRNPARIRLEVQGDPGTLHLPPMTLLPPVENAVKHAAGQQMDDAISVHVRLAGRAVVMTVCNVVGNPVRGAAAPGGLGLPAWRQRLHLCLPGSHRLRHGREGDVYRLELEIDALPCH